MRVRLAALATALCLGFPTRLPAQDRPDTGTYFSASGLLVSVLDADLRDPALPGLDLELSAELGFGFALALGGRLGRDVRVEGEIAYRMNDLDELAVAGFGSAPIDGEITSFSVLGNFLYDLPVRGAVRPYFGVGLGLARLEVSGEDINDDSDTVLAYQLLFGLGGRVGPRAILFGGYRFFATDDPVFRGAETEYRSHNLEIGLRYLF
ncbi:MAG TPA: outer membrane beta-barrel protein [Thermodesulfobacteriota bacterium]|nr:outer membrane beta-barrel protein [Thermodesulfobacteriota bacterium]